MNINHTLFYFVAVAPTGGMILNEGLTPWGAYYKWTVYESLLWSWWSSLAVDLDFRRGCAAEAAKPVPIFKGHFGGKGYPLLRVFSQENCVFVYFSDEKGENI